jgi:hypothetical protein
MSKPRLGTQRYRFRPFEDESHLECLCRLNLRGRNVGAYLLKHQGQYSLVFGFCSRGIHTQLQPGQAEPTLKRLEDGLKGFRPGDRLRIHWRSFADDRERQQSLETLIQTTATLESQFLLLAQQRATRDLTTEKQRQPKQLYLFATYPLGSGQEQSADHVEKLLAWVVAQYDTVKGLKEQNQQQSYVQLLTQGFTDGYLHWEQQLNARMGLQVTPMGTEDLWHYLWHQFNTTSLPQVPQCLELSDADGDAKLSELIHDSLHATSRLIRGENGQPSHPKADRQWVQVKGKFVGAVVLESKPAGFTTPEHQLYYLWQALAQFPDCECVCELAAADRIMTRVTLQRLTKQSVTATFRANLLRDVDVASQMRMKQGVEARSGFTREHSPSGSVVWCCCIGIPPNP